MATLLREAQTTFVQGMNGAASVTGFRPGEVELILNGRVGLDGSAEVRYGSKRRHAAALNSGAQCYGLASFASVGGTTYWVGVFGQNAYVSTDEGATWSAITGATSLGARYWSWATMKDGATVYLIGCNGGSSIYKYDGTTWAALGAHPSGVTAFEEVEVFNERLYTHDGRTVYASKIADPDTWATPDGLVLPVQTHDASKITAMAQLGPVLVVTKRDSVAYIDGFGNSDIIVQAGARGLSRSVGCAAPRTLIPCGDSGLAWLSERGIEFFDGQAVRQVGKGLQAFVQGTIAWDVILTDQDVPVAWFLPEYNELNIAVPTTASTARNTAVLRVRLDTDGAARDSYSTGTAAPLAAVMVADVDSVNAQPVGGDYAGFCHRMENGASDNLASDGSGGTALDFRLRDQPRLFGEPSRKKRLRTVRVSGVPESGTAAVTVYGAGDGSFSSGQSKTLAAATNDNPTRVKALLNRRGLVVQAEVRSAAAGLKITTIETSAEVLGEAA